MKATYTGTWLHQEDDSLALEVLRDAIIAEYHCVATEPERGFHYHTGRALIPITGYREEWLAGIPETTIASFAGTGNPFSQGGIYPGERVVDVGCGAGLDSLIASGKTGPAGRVIGVDMTPAMIRKATMAADIMQRQNVEFRRGFAEALPVGNDWADVIISNGMLNLTPDKRAVLAEMTRVLRPGGRLQIADILITTPVPESSKKRADLWTGCIAGALMQHELEEVVMAAGFARPEITWWADVYAGAPQSGSAHRYGTAGINFRTIKPG